MANVTSGDPFIIDTATDTAIFTDDFLVYAIAWTSASVADTILVEDEDGVVKYSSSGTIANHSEHFAFPSGYPLRFNGLKVPTLSAGKVYLYVKVLG